MVRKEYEGKVGPFGGRKSTEYTEKYKLIKEGIIAAEETRKGEECNSECVGKVETALLVLQDLSPSVRKDALEKALIRTLENCAKTEECDICKELIPMNEEKNSKKKSSPINKL